MTGFLAGLSACLAPAARSGCSCGRRSSGAVAEPQASHGAVPEGEHTSRKRQEPESPAASGTAAQEEQKRPRFLSPDWSASEAEDDEDAALDRDSDCESLSSEAPSLCLQAGSLSPQRRRLQSGGDASLTEDDVTRQFCEWKESLADVTAQPDEVLEELLVANVREYGWDTGERLTETLLSCSEDAAARSARSALYARARLPEPKLAVRGHDEQAVGCGSPGGDEVCVVCLETGGNLLRVSEVCGHRLHSACLSAGLRLQLGGGTSLRCPACPARRSAPVPHEIAAAALGAEWSADYKVEASHKWLRAGCGTLFSTCPSGTCRMRPGSENYTMQVVCGCAEAHRFCCYCGQEPHEPVPCAHMMELRQLVDGAKGELQSAASSRASYDAEVGSHSDHVALLQDVEEANRQSAQQERVKEEQEEKVPGTFAFDGSIEALQDAYERLLGSRPEGSLRRSAELSLVLMRGWRLQPIAGTASGRAAVAAPDAGLKDAGVAGNEAAAAEASTAAAEAMVQSRSIIAGVAKSEEVLEATTRPCPKCFISIERTGGCQHMTCSNPQCRHEFCWLCLRDWHSPSHDFLSCALSRVGIGGGQADKGILDEVEGRIQDNWRAQPEETRQASQEAFAEEVRRRFELALTKELEGDRDLLAAGMHPATEPHALHLSLRLLQLYEHRERLAREVAAEVFSGSVAPVLRAERESQLRGLLGWLQSRWWLRLNPEDAAQPTVHVEEDYALDERPLVTALSAARQRAVHAVYCLQRREADLEKAQLQASLAERCLARYGSAALGIEQRAEALQLLTQLLSEPHRGSGGTGSGGRSGDTHHSAAATAMATAQRALTLACAAERAWGANRFLELVGALAPASGCEAQRSAMLAGRWADEVRERAAAMRKMLDAGGPEDDLAWQERLQGASSFLDAARRSVFQFALEYCGGTRRLVRRRGEN
mmetsp:Transcript_65625/g.170447  ORF Transcript_65625/g.170447 Transcript_65625/m.170447 type:complete len:942 (-) Transcript_65625:68-2893(-)